MNELKVDETEMNEALDHFYLVELEEIEKKMISYSDQCLTVIKHWNQNEENYRLHGDMKAIEKIAKKFGLTSEGEILDMKEQTQGPTVTRTRGLTYFGGGWHDNEEIFNILKYIEKKYKNKYYFIDKTSSIE